MPGSASSKLERINIQAQLSRFPLPNDDVNGLVQAFFDQNVPFGEAEKRRIDLLKTELDSHPQITVMKHIGFIVAKLNLPVRRLETLWDLIQKMPSAQIIEFEKVLSLINELVSYRNSSKAARQLLNSILDFSRVGSGQKHQGDLTEIVSRCLNLFESKIRYNKITIKNSMMPSVKSVYEFFRNQSRL